MRIQGQICTIPGENEMFSRVFCEQMCQACCYIKPDNLLYFSNLTPLEPYLLSRHPGGGIIFLSTKMEILGTGNEGPGIAAGPLIQGLCAEEGKCDARQQAPFLPANPAAFKNLGFADTLGESLGDLASTEVRVRAEVGRGSCIPILRKICEGRCAQSLMRVKSGPLAAFKAGL
jgi:hypothetical protein